MIIRVGTILLFVLFTPLIIYSQYTHTNNAKIELVNGEAAEGIVTSGISGASGKEKIWVYYSENKRLKIKRKNPVNEINKITMRLDESMIYEVKKT